MSWLRAIPFLFTLLAFVLQPASASAFGPAHPEARVSAFELVATTLVGASAETSPGLHEGIGHAYDETASGYRFAARGSGGVFRIPRSVGAARHAIYDRLEGAIGRYGGELVEGGVRFPSRRAARQAASEIAGNMGSGARAIRASEFRGGPWSWRNSNGVIGRQSADGRVLWRDDVLGHPQFGMGPHVNVEVDGIGLHLFY